MTDTAAVTLDLDPSPLHQCSQWLTEAGFAGSAADLWVGWLVTSAATRTILQNRLLVRLTSPLDGWDGWDEGSMRLRVLPALLAYDGPLVGNWRVLLAAVADYQPWEAKAPVVDWIRMTGGGDDDGVGTDGLATPERYSVLRYLTLGGRSEQIEAVRRVSFVR